MKFHHIKSLVVFAILLITATPASARAPAYWLFQDVGDYYFGQDTNKTCQSNLLSISLIQAGYKEHLFYPHMANEAQLQVVYQNTVTTIEKELRKIILVEKGKAKLSNRSHWQSAVEKLTGNQYTLKGTATTHNGKFGKFYTYDSFKTIVKRHFLYGAACLTPKLTSCTPLMKGSNGKNSLRPILITSTTRIGKTPYRSGHVFGIINTRPSIKYKPSTEYYILNSSHSESNPYPLMCAAKIGDNEKGWVGRLSWTSDFMIKKFNVSGKNNLAINWIEPL